MPHHFILMVNTGSLLDKLLHNLNVTLRGCSLQCSVARLIMIMMIICTFWRTQASLRITVNMRAATISIKIWRSFNDYDHDNNDDYDEDNIGDEYDDYDDGQKLTKSCSETSQPPSIRAATVSPWPALAAWWRAVWPSWNVFMKYYREIISLNVIMKCHEQCLFPCTNGGGLSDHPEMPSWNIPKHHH